VWGSVCHAPRDVQIACHAGAHLSPGLTWRSPVTVIAGQTYAIAIY
jgi:hypothetical protein